MLTPIPANEERGKQTAEKMLQKIMTLSLRKRLTTKCNIFLNSEGTSLTPASKGESPSGREYKEGGSECDCKPGCGTKPGCDCSPDRNATRIEMQTRLWNRTS